MIRNPRWPKYWPTHIVVRLATLGSLGKLKAPGTWGSLAGLLLYVLVFHHLTLFGSVLLALACCYVAIGICGEAEKRLNKVDPGEVIFDEFIAMPVCLFGLKPYLGHSYSFLVILAAFLLFRVFDIFKPLGIKRLQRYYGGFGVVIDDVAAALLTCLLMNVGMQFIPIA